ncbi:MAG: hypothetical protein RIF33_20715 [Cyclobacteriaceae bacterium]
MRREVVIKNTIDKIEQLSDQKVLEVSHFVDLLMNQMEDELTTLGIHKLISNSATFDFLKEEEELYSDSDLIERFSEEG